MVCHKCGSSNISINTSTYNKTQICKPFVAILIVSLLLTACSDLKEKNELDESYSDIETNFNIEGQLSYLDDTFDLVNSNLSYLNTYISIKLSEYDISPELIDQYQVETKIFDKYLKKPYIELNENLKDLDELLYSFNNSDISNDLFLELKDQNINIRGYAVSTVEKLNSYYDLIDSCIINYYDFISSNTATLKFNENSYNNGIIDYEKYRFEVDQYYDITCFLSDYLVPNVPSPAPDYN